MAKIECLCVKRTPNRAYPVNPDSPAWGQVSRDLVRDVADLLAWHGFPKIETDDLDFNALTWVILRFCTGAPCGSARSGLR